MINEFRTILNNATNGVCFNSYRYCADEEINFHTINYEDTETFTILKDRYGETDTSLKNTKNLFDKAKQISNSKPLFKYFLDGSRKIYKIDDIEINNRVFPIMAGQVGVACCKRQDINNFKCIELENNLILTLPNEANPELRNPELFFNNLREKINKTSRIEKSGLRFSRICDYSSKINDTSEALKYENLGIALIQNEMVDNEKKVVSNLTNKSLLNENSYLIKDGSLQYKPMMTGEYKELSKIKNNYRWVIGISKLFNPEFSLDRTGKNNAGSIAKLELYHRTPAYMFQHDISKQSYFGDYKYSIWYVRIRDAKYTESPFAGVLKIEKILITEEENNNGIDSDLIDLITANIINERNPVCYGKDSRWANHLYPIYLTELFLKNKFLSDIHFLNLF